MTAEPVPNQPRVRAVPPQPSQPDTGYSAEQDAALDHLAHIIAGVVARELAEQSPKLARRRKSV